MIRRNFIGAFAAFAAIDFEGGGKVQAKKAKKGELDYDVVFVFPMLNGLEDEKSTNCYSISKAVDPKPLLTGLIAFTCDKVVVHRENGESSEFDMPRGEPMCPLAQKYEDDLKVYARLCQRLNNYKLEAGDVISFVRDDQRGGQCLAVVTGVRT